MLLGPLNFEEEKKALENGRADLHPLGWLLLNKTKQTTSIVENVEKLKPSCIAGGNVKWKVCQFLKKN